MTTQQSAPQYDRSSMMSRVLYPTVNRLYMTIGEDNELGLRRVAKNFNKETKKNTFIFNGFYPNQAKISGDAVEVQVDRIALNISDRGPKHEYGAIIGQSTMDIMRWDAESKSEQPVSCTVTVALSPAYKRNSEARTAERNAFLEACSGLEAGDIVSFSSLHANEWVQKDKEGNVTNTFVHLEGTLLGKVEPEPAPEKPRRSRAGSAK